eukprot:3058123-Pyramimonas_sp.AAC.1
MGYTHLESSGKLPGYLSPCPHLSAGTSSGAVAKLSTSAADIANCRLAMAAIMRDWALSIPRTSSTSSSRPPSLPVPSHPPLPPSIPAPSMCTSTSLFSYPFCHLPPFCHADEEDDDDDHDHDHDDDHDDADVDGDNEDDSEDYEADDGADDHDDDDDEADDDAVVFLFLGVLQPPQVLRRFSCSSSSPSSSSSLSSSPLSSLRRC